MYKDKICLACGQKFTPTSSTQKYCNRVVTKKCTVCGKEFQSKCGDSSKTCSKKCKDKLGAMNREKFWSKQTKICEWCGKEFHPTSNTAKFCQGRHFKKCKVCGKEFEIDVLDEISRNRLTCSKECQNKISVATLNSESSREKMKATMVEKYGVPYPTMSPAIRQRQLESMIDKYGFMYPMQNPESKKKILTNSKQSNLEIRICNLLDNYNIKYEQHHVVAKDNFSHEFDFFIPEFNLLIDADGVYYHSYLDDPDGEHVRDDYDEVRLYLVPEGYIFQVLVEGSEEHQLKSLIATLEKLGGSLDQYDSEIFHWCRSMEFPYVQYSDTRLLKDWKSLCSYHNDRYIPQCRLGESVIKQFHTSIYNCHVGNNLSPYEGWYNDDKLKQVIKNRLIYINNIDPSKILSGFNISKICPCISMFNPILAKYLISKYLNSFTTVFDPFSGFSGRLLGAASLNKRYIGQDLNYNAVTEANRIIKYLSLPNCNVVHSDILECSEGSYECLLTCPPYGKKEIYNLETVFKTCDEWIDVCLAKFECQVYVFVVDETDKYKEYIAETISNNSHFSNMQEKVIVIDKRKAV